MTKEVFGTREWAASNENIYWGCRHGCKYCYSRAESVRHGKSPAEFDTPVLRKRKENKKFGKRNGTIMFPTAHDLHPNDIDVWLPFLERMLKAGNKVLIVSKPHPSCVRTMCSKLKKYKDNILFRFTIGSANKAILRFWEPKAPDYLDRIISLKHAYYEDFNTSISCEPMLDDNILKVIEDTRDYVTDYIWLGKVNFLTKRLEVNGFLNEETERMAKQLLEWQSDEKILSLYELLKDHPKIKWKESIKKVVGLKIPTKAGLDA